MSEPLPAGVAPASAADRPVLLAGAGLRKSYRLGASVLEVLAGAEFAVQAGEFVTITGASGSGKSTLLHLLGLLDRPDAGEVRYAGQPVWQQGPDWANEVRNRHIGFVFQFYHLLPELDVLENVLLPVMVMQGVLAYHPSRSAAAAYADELLNRFGLVGRRNHRPAQLSGGERQRVAIARALINRPDVLLADEPTGNLDRRTGEGILQVLQDLNREGQTVVMVTHDERMAAAGHRTVRLVDGRVV